MNLIGKIVIQKMEFKIMKPKLIRFQSYSVLGGIITDFSFTLKFVNFEE